MKRILTVLFFVAATALSASAGQYDYLTIQKTDGTAQSFTALGLKITFSGSNMVATQDGQSTTFALADLNKMFFSDTANGIELLNTEGDTRGTRTEVFDLQGRKVMEGQPAQGRLPKGIYIVGNKKVAVK